jgi:hypothetical protein
MFETINYMDTARTRYTDQFKGSINFDYLMLVWMLGYQELQEVFLELITINDIDQASGVQLDVIGAIVGQPRTLEDIDATGFFGFSSDAGAKSFGSTENAAGGLYLSLYQQDASGAFLLPDNAYRSFIKAKVLSNNSGGTPEDIIQSAQAVFQTSTVELTENSTESGSLSLYIGRDWNDEQLTAFPGLDETVVAERLLPIPVGVSVEYTNTPVGTTLQAVDSFEEASNYLSSVANISLYDNIGDDKF